MSLTSPALPTIDADHFFAVDIRAGRVLTCEPFPEARVPTYRLTIDVGHLGIRRSSARLVGLYPTPEDLIGRTVIVVVNLPPRQIGPVRSEVLILGVYQDGDPSKVTLLTPEHPCRAGDRVG